MHCIVDENMGFQKSPHLNQKKRQKSMSIAANKLIKIEDVWLVHFSIVENLKLLNFSFNLIQKQTPLFLYQTKTEAKHVDIFTADCGVSAENK